MICFSCWNYKLLVKPRYCKVTFRKEMHFKPIFVPIILASLLTLTFIITFSLAVYLEHITYMIPYISDSGVHPPESTIFTQMINIHTVFMAGAVYIRYRQVRYLFEKHSFAYKHIKLNQTSAYLGYLASIGGSLVANFNEVVNLPMHLLGAYMIFGLGSLYFCTQTRLYILLQKVCGHKKINICRAVLSIVVFITFCIFSVTSVISISQFTGTDPTKWRAEDGGLLFHNIGSTCEWICASCSMVFLLLFVYDFEKVTIYEPEVFVEDDFIEPINLYNRNREENTEEQ